MTDDYPIKSPKKLIEVALPLDAINIASAREKSIRHGHPSTLHLWWARRPLAAARAVIFSQLVNDPEDLWRVQNPGQEANKQVRGHWTKARARLFKIIEDLVLWENTTNQEVLEKAREEIRKSWREVCELNQDHPQAGELFNLKKMPGLHDPFAGGGAIPLEAQRLGLDAYASDLNPVAVLINKAMIEFPPKFAGMPPVNPESRTKKQLVDREWKGADGLAEDVRCYGKWMRDEAEKRIGHLYPRVEITDAMIQERPDLEPYRGNKLPVIAWLWARTVKSPNPAFSHVDVPLASTFVVCSKKGQEAYVEPVVAGEKYILKVKIGALSESSKRGTSAGTRKGFLCLLSNAPISFEYIRQQAKQFGFGERMIARVAVCNGKRIYLSPEPAGDAALSGCDLVDVPEIPILEQTLSIRVALYGLNSHGKLFTRRQALMLSTLCALVEEVHQRLTCHLTLRDSDDKFTRSKELDDSYAAAVCTYLALTVSKLTSYHCTLGIWRASDGKSGRAFGRQSIPMVWDFPECNPFVKAGGELSGAINDCAKVIESMPAAGRGTAWQSAAQTRDEQVPRRRIVSTDPPYYDNVNYAELSDFFYGWLRKSLRFLNTPLLSTIATPKSDELIAAPHRHDGRDNAESYFLTGMSRALTSIASQTTTVFPTTIYYAFKQSEVSQSGTTSTGWETFLSAVIDSGVAIVGTWPMRTEQSAALKSKVNSLASSVVLVCRRRSIEAESVSRREFIRELNATLPLALDAMTRENEDLPSPVAPVDLSQAIIGPGMAIFSKYSAVLEADGSPMSVRTALQLINRFLAEDDFDADTQFCLHWFETHGWEPGVFGEADVLARAKATSVGGLDDAGVIRSGAGKVKLLKWSEYPANWDPNKDMRLPIWETLHQLIRALRQGGESAAGVLLSQGNVQSRAEAARQLAYRLYTLCERKGWAEDARAYNELITSWSAIETATPQVRQGELF